MRPRITVGIPSYNRRDETRRAIGSVLEQQYSHVRVLISDNASTDGTPEMLRALNQQHENIVLLLQPANAGPVANFQTLWDSVNDGYFMWLGDDDWLGEDCLEACAEQLDQHGDLVMAAPSVRYHGTGRTWIEQPSINLLDDDARTRVLEYFRHVTSNGVYYGLTRRSAAGDLPPLRRAMSSDWLHVSALAYRGKVRTVESVELHRSVGGATASLADVARHLQLGRLAATAPQLVIAWEILVDIGWRSPVYSRLTRSARLRLGAHAAAIVLRRFLPRALAKFARLQMRKVTARRRPQIEALL